ncbi:MAG: hypothetical protein KAS78_03455, partial [Candidatus Pacebacteria bacterium]|nr:hypothetical protein [Candidatus Paceibacterota bacterium]
RKAQKREKQRIAREAANEAARVAATIKTAKKEQKPPKKHGVTTRRNLKVKKEKPKSKKGGAYRISFKKISESADEYINALDTKNKPGVDMSISAHVAFRHKTFGEIFPVVIQKATAAQGWKKSKKLNTDDIGDWVKENVTNWRDGIYFSRIGHTNIISDRPLNMFKNIVGRALISSKKVEQNTRKGKNIYYFPHIIILEGQDRKPAFTLVIDNTHGENIPGEVHIGPTIGALRNDKKVEEYLHLIPCK